MRRWGVPLLLGGTVWGVGVTGYVGLWTAGVLAFWQVLAGGLIWLLAGTAVGVYRYVAVSTRFQPSGRHVCAWSLWGAIGLGSIGLGLSVYRWFGGRTVVDPGYLFANLLVGGASVGLLIGLYEGRGRWWQDRLDEQTTETDQLAEQLSVILRILRHDVRTQTNLVLGHIERVEAEYGESEHTRAIRRAAEDVHSYGEDALFLEKALRREWHETTTVDLVAVVEGAIDRATADRSAVTVDSDLPETCPVEAPETINRAVYEVFQNAVDHDDAPPTTIRVDCTVEDETATLRVADDGPGIPAAELQVVQTAGIETALEHASGTGLWIIRWTAEYAGGEVSFESDDDGTTVVLTFVRASAG